MNLREWRPTYESILSDFGFSKDEDVKGARLLNSLLSKRNVAPTKKLRHLISGKRVIVAGHSAGLERDIERQTCKMNARKGRKENQKENNATYIAADGATSILLKFNIIPQLIATDLDGNVEDQLHANEEGSIAIIHAHGDNIETLSKWVPRFKGEVVGTTQAEPFGRLHNFGGFTDGDRGVCIASHFGAGNIELVGFDFLNVNLAKDGVREDVKLKKMRWAYRIIRSLGLSV